MILATSNRHKLEEMTRLLPGVGLRPMPDGLESPEEDGSTFAANALIKARAAHRATGEPVIADDSGIVVDALGGEPGIRSARYAGPEASDQDNLTKVLRDLAAAGGPRTARYVCVIALVAAEGEKVFEGVCEGELVEEPRGSGGFGYDPAFVPQATGAHDRRTMAELTPEEKNRLSHRGAAAKALTRYLEGSGQA